VKASYGGRGLQWRSKWGYAPWGAGFGGAPAHFLQAFKNALAEI